MVLLLLLGMAALVGAVLLLPAAFTRRTPKVTGVAEGLAEIETVYGTAPRAAGDADDALAESVLLRRLGGLARRLSPAGTVERLRRQLDAAGNPRPWTPERVLGFKGLGLVGLGLLGGLLTLTRGPVWAVFGLGVGMAAGFFLPDLLVYNAGLRRQEEYRRALPDVLDLLVVSVEAGLGFDAALSRVATNLTGPLVGEFRRVLQEMQIGMSREEALQGMAARTSVDELGSFVGALVQAGELGIPIGGVLREQAREMRIKRRQRAEEQAQKVGVKISMPVIGCILPALFAAVLGPGILTLLHSGLLH